MNNSEVKIGNRIIGTGHPTYIIAEIGSNHNGSFEIAKQLIDVVAEAGADAVKFQSFTVDNWLSSDFTIPSMKNRVDDWKKYLRGFELNYEMYDEIADYCKERNIVCFSTPSHKTDIDKLNELNVPAFKFGSVQITDLPTIEYAAKLGKPIILAAGAADTSEVLKAVEVILDTGNDKLALMHCTSVYPCQDYYMINLNVLHSYQTMFDFPIGYSDHTLDSSIIPVAAVAMGAKIIEKHVTLDRSMSGPDHAFALEPLELATMVDSIRKVEQALGHGYRRLLPEEAELARFGRRSLVAMRDIWAGETIGGEDLTIKRPGYGIAPVHMELVVGRIARRDIKADHVLTWEMI